MWDTSDSREGGKRRARETRWTHDHDHTADRRARPFGEPRDWDWPTAFDRPALERILTLDFLERGER